MQFQGFDGGAHGGTIDWASSEAVGSPVWFAGGGTAKFTASDSIHGTTAAAVSNSAGNTQAALVVTPTSGAQELRAHAYFRVPATRPAGDMGLMYLSSQNTGVHVVAAGDGSLFVSSWQGQVGTRSAAGTLPAAGAVIRVSIRANVATQAFAAAVYQGESTTPLWQANGTLSAVQPADTFENIQVGLTTSSESTVIVNNVIDSIREEDGPGTAAAFLPPELNNPATQRRHQTWVLIGTTWTNLGTRRQIPAT